MPPKFTLQPILEYHHNRVEVLEVVLGRLEKARRLSQEAMERLLIEQEGFFAQLADYQCGELDLMAIAQTRDMIKRTYVRIAHQQREMDKLDKQIEAKRAEVVAARQDEAVMENLRDKELDRFFEKENQQETVIIDDIYTSKAYHKAAKAAHEEEVYL